MSWLGSKKLSKAQYLDIINDFAVELISQSTIEETLQLVTQKVVSRLNLEDCVIYLLDVKTGRLIQKAAYGPKSLGNYEVNDPIALNLGEGIVGRVAATGSYRRVNDTRKDPGYVADDQARLSELALPLIYDGQVIGVIDSEHSKKGFFTDEYVKILTTIASMLSAKLGKTISVERLKTTVDQLKYAEKLQRKLFEIARLPHETKNIEDFYRALHQIINDLMYAKNFYISIHDYKTGLVHIPYFVDSLDKMPTNHVASQVLMGTITNYIMQSQEPLLLNRSELQQMINDGKCTCIGTIPNYWLGVPFELTDNETGAVVVQSYLSNIGYSEKDKKLLVYVSEHIKATMKQMHAEQKIQHQALHDALTGLPNRLLFNDRLEQAINRSKRHSPTMLAIMFLDLDRFKQINDSLGHLAGDALLAYVSQKVQSCIRPNDTMARFGGDEFAIIIEEVDDREEVIYIAERIIDILEKPFIFDGKNIFTSTSIGIVISEKAELSAHKLLHQADKAMYAAKANGRGCFQVYDDSLEKNELNISEVEADLRTAIKQKQFILYYQPIVDLNNRKIVSFEVLCRWQHPKKGLVMPNDFIPLAESAGLIQELDWTVTSLALSSYKNWMAKYPTTAQFQLNINFSGSHFRGEGIAERFQAVLKNLSIPASTVRLEITESILIENLEQVRIQLSELKELGISVILDDFGTGYSSLSYINQLPLDTLKIDKSFITNMEDDTETNPIISSITTLAEALKMKVVAEGIEKEYQLNRLLQLGCRYGQGFYLSRPVAEDKVVEKWLNRTVKL